MINKIKPKSEFARNVLTLMTGTTIAQSIPILVTPVLTRLYSPDDFGLYAIYIGLISIGAVIATGRYEMAVMLPKKHADAIQIVVHSILRSFAFSLLILLIIIGFNQYIAELLGDVRITGWLYLAPLSIFLFSVYSILLYWLNRKHEYRAMSKNRVIQSSSITMLQVLIGAIGKLMAGLAIADFVGRLVSVLIIVKKCLPDMSIVPSKLKRMALAKRYIKFPKYEMPASLLNILSFQAPYLVIPVLFTSSIAGSYFLVFRVLMMPISLVGTAMLEVFRNRSTEDFRRHGTCRPIFIKTMFALLAIGLPPMLVLMFFGKELFVFVFGQSWKDSGVYAQILAPMALLRFISAPLSYIFFIRERLGLDLLLQAIFFVMTVISIFVGWYLSSTIYLIILLSLSGCVFYLLQVIVSYNLSEARS